MNRSNPHMIKCIGCGAVLQDEDENKEGYLPSSALKQENEDRDLYCQRCFKLRHYNELLDIELDENQYKEILNEISNRQALIVLVVDLFDFEGSFIQGIQRFALNNKIMIVGNKFDLLPLSTKESSIRQWVMKRSHELGVRPEKILITSAKKRQYIDELMASIEELRQGRDVYFLGASNVGKSTLMNAILSESIGEEALITSSYFPGTTLGKIEIPLDDGSLLIDTPGIIQDQQLNYYLKAKDLKAITPRKTIKPKSYQLNAGQSILFGGLGRMDLEQCPDKSSVVIYVAEGVDLHRTKTAKAAEVSERLVGRELTPPHRVEDFQWPLKDHSYKLKADQDILISGLGWVRLPAGVTVRMWAPAPVNVNVRPPMI